MSGDKQYISDYTGDDSIPGFVTFCIEQYKDYKNISGKESMKLLSDAGALEYLAEGYPSLHLESRQWLMKELDELVATKVLLQ